MLTKLLHDVIRLLIAWWRVDRVRTSPREGRLLRLEPPCVVVVGARPAEVIARTTGRTAAGPFVVYDCRSATGVYQLRVVPLGDGHAPVVHIIEAGVEQELVAEDVEVFQAIRALPHSMSEDQSTLETHGETPYR